MPRTPMVLSAGARLSDFLSLGQLAKLLPPDLVARVLAETGKQSKRIRSLPAAAMVYYVIAMSLYREVNANEVLRIVCEGLNFFGEGKSSADVGKSGISQARSRLGDEVMQRLATEVLQPIILPDALLGTQGCILGVPVRSCDPENMATYANTGALEGPKPTPRLTPVDPIAGGVWRGLSVVALDGCTIEVSDDPDNSEAFGRPGTGQGVAGFPQLRFTALFECASGTLFGVALGGYKDSEAQLARQSAESLKPHMLCLFDRGFAGFPMWSRAIQTGAKVLIRVPKNRKLPKKTILSDGSFLSTIEAAALTASKHEDLKDFPKEGLVRVIEYVLPGHPKSESKYRLITNLLDEKRYPAHELAQLYAKRWGIETSFADLKSTLKGSKVVMRSKTPELVRQEFWGLLLAYQAVRHLMWEAALYKRIRSGELSFGHTLSTLRRKLPQSGAIPP